MADEVLDYRSTPVTIDNRQIQTISDQKGMKCTWTVNRSYDTVSSEFVIDYNWDFDWTELAVRGVTSVIGRISVTSNNSILFYVDIDLNEPIQNVSQRMESGQEPFDVIYKYSLLPIGDSIRDVSFDEIFAPSDQNNRILIVDGKRLHVNTSFLSYHSEFFRALFSSNYREGQMDEIPIGEVSYEDFGLLLGVIHPKTVFPTDKTAEKLLVMADRFLMPTVIGHVEYHLLNNTKIENEILIEMAEQYGMEKLLEKITREMNTVEEAEEMKTVPKKKKKFFKRIFEAGVDRLLEKVARIVVEDELERERNREIEEVRVLAARREAIVSYEEVNFILKFAVGGLIVTMIVILFC